MCMYGIDTELGVVCYVKRGMSSTVVCVLLFFRQKIVIIVNEYTHFNVYKTAAHKWVNYNVILV
jgi:hypothetical protein